MVDDVGGFNEFGEGSGSNSAAGNSTVGSDSPWFGGSSGGGIAAGGVERNGIVTARGTADGLVLRLDGALDHQSLRSGLWGYIESRRHFVEGNEIILEWTGEAPDESFVQQLREELIRDFGVRFKAGKSLREQIVRESRVDTRTPSILDGIEALGFSATESKGSERNSAVRPGSSQSSSSAAVWDDADTRLVYGTLRSGQKVESEHSVVIFGDVNSGAEVVAGGDVVVLGILRGIAHAGAYDEGGGGRSIFALNLQPTQLRIGSVISRGAAGEGYAGPELARVDGTSIVVEPYQSRGAPSPRINGGARTGSAAEARRRS